MIFTSNSATTSVFSSEHEAEKVFCSLSCRKSVAKPELQFVHLAAFSFFLLSCINQTHSGS